MVRDKLIFQTFSRSHSLRHSSNWSGVKPLARIRCRASSNLTRNKRRQECSTPKNGRLTAVNLGIFYIEQHSTKNEHFVYFVILLWNFHTNCTPRDIFLKYSHHRFDLWWPLQPLFHWKLIIFGFISLRHYFTLLKHGIKLKVLIYINWLLFEVSISFHCKVMIIL